MHKIIFFKKKAYKKPKKIRFVIMGNVF